MVATSGESLVALETTPPFPRSAFASRWFLGAIAFAVAWWIVDLAVLRAGTPHPLDDVWEDGVAARLLLSGEPWQTLMIYPPLWPMRDPNTLTVPVLIHGPLLPLLLAVPLQVLGPGLLDQLAWVAALCAVLVAFPLYRMTARFLGAPVGAAAIGLFTVSPITLDAVHHSLSVVLGALLFAVGFELATRERPRSFVAGLAVGLGYLVRPEMLVVAPILALVAGSAAGPRAIAAVLGGFAAMAGAWWVHHALIVGSPFFNLTSYTLIGYWGERPGTMVLRDFTLTIDRWPRTLVAELPGLWRKWVYMFPRALRHAAFAPTLTTGWLMLAGAAACLGNPATRRMAGASLLLALIPVAMMTLAYPQRLYVLPFLPLYAAAAAAGAHVLSGWLPAGARAPRVWVTLLGLLAVASAVPALRTATEDAVESRALLASERRALAAVTRRSGQPPRPMFSDRPDFVAWTTSRPTLLMTREEYERYYPLAGPHEADRGWGLPARRDPADTWFHDGHWARGARALLGVPGVP
jgi:hypothetical protein